jgi:hypothetical protein
MRAGRIGYLNRALPRAIRSIPLTDLPDGYPANWYDWIYARHSPQWLDSRESEPHAAPWRTWRFAYDVGCTPARFYSALAADLEQCRKEWRELTWIVNARFGADEDLDFSPHLRDVIGAIQDYQDLVAKILVEKQRGTGNPLEDR